LRKIRKSLRSPSRSVRLRRRPRTPDYIFYVQRPV
jgi:hypothetical protein